MIEFLSLRQKIVSSAVSVYKNSCLKMLKPLTLGLLLTKIKKNSKTSINEYADIGFLCRAPLSNLKYFVVFRR